MLIGHKSRNHPQQVARDGVDDTIDDRRTPSSVYDPLHAVYGYDLDVAASAENAKCERFFTREMNGLLQPWDGNVWCNPPYSDIAPWVRKASQESRRLERVRHITMLLPANRTDRPPFGLVVVHWGWK